MLSLANKMQDYNTKHVDRMSEGYNPIVLYVT